MKPNVDRLFWKGILVATIIVVAVALALCAVL